LHSHPLSANGPIRSASHSRGANITFREFMTRPPMITPRTGRSCAPPGLHRQLARVERDERGASAPTRASARSYEPPPEPSAVRTGPPPGRHEDHRRGPDRVRPEPRPGRLAKPQPGRRERAVEDRPVQVARRQRDRQEQLVAAFGERGRQRRPPGSPAVGAYAATRAPDLFRVSPGSSRPPRRPRRRRMYGNRRAAIAGRRGRGSAAHAW